MEEDWLLYFHSALLEGPQAEVSELQGACFFTAFCLTEESDTFPLGAESRDKLERQIPGWGQNFPILRSFLKLNKIFLPLEYVPGVPGVPD